MSTPNPKKTARRRDPRPYQIAVLSSLLIYGVFRLDLEVQPLFAICMIATCLLCQVWCTRHWNLPRFDPRSALISGLSLCLLLRTDSLFWAMFAAVITVVGKFTIRRSDKHVFNPTNFGIAVVLSATWLLPGAAWVSPGQWGTPALFAVLLAGLGGLVVMRAERSDVTWAFLTIYGSMLLARAAWLGDPLRIPLHQLASGGFLIFTFLMISDPKTTPNSRLGRIVFAALVAAVAYGVRFGLYQSNDLIWALFVCAPLVPVIDLILPGRRYVWVSQERNRTMNRSRPVPATVVVLLALLLIPASASAFCGFYVAKADTDLFNTASKVVLVRDDDRTVITMANDYRGEASEFAVVIPVPTFLEREQIRVGDRAVIEHLDAYTAPRLVEYHDGDPCAPARLYEESMLRMDVASPKAKKVRQEARSLGVSVEAQYAIGEYDISILSAEESDGLETWLRRNGYRLPEGASRVLGSYIKQNMRFFVAKVNLAAQQRLGFTYLRPLQIAFESPKFRLPIRLGTLNADGPQELFVFALTRTGRVETTNYRTVRLPSNLEIPEFVDQDFGEFYQAMFARQAEKERLRTVFLEYAWDMNWCDPCAADPLSPEQLRSLGVFWIDPGGEAIRGQARDVFVTRLHLRYTEETFPEDLVFQETGDRQNFQGRYVLRRPWKGDLSCDAGRRYEQQLRARQEAEAKTLASLTGWDLSDVYDRIPGRSNASSPPSGADDVPWWKKLWSSGD